MQEIDGQDMQAFLDALNNAKERDNGKPQLIIAHTLIGKGIPEVAGTSKAHGEGGAKFVEAARKGLGLPEEHYFVSDDVRDYFAGHKKDLLAEYDRWEKTYQDWRKKNPTRRNMLDDALEQKSAGRSAREDSRVSRRRENRHAQSRERSAPAARAGDAVSDQRQRRSARLHAELHQGWRRLHAHDPGGRNIHFGIREHGMCAIMNGIAYHGIFRASGATFLVFADYCRASIRLAALSQSAEHLHFHA